MQRFLLIGLGSIGKRHLKNLRSLFPEAEIIVYRHRGCDDDINFDDDAYKCVSTIGEAISKEPQAAIVANPASHHLKVAMLLADAGVHLLIEKPLSSSIEDLDDLIAMCWKKGVVLMTGYNLRFLPSLRKFREYLLEGCVGKILSVRSEVGQFLPDWRPGGDYRQTVTAQKKLGGGVLLELSHEIDYLLWFFGPINFLTAVLSTQSELEIDVEDVAHLILVFKSDEDDHKVIASLNMDFFRHDMKRECTVIGSKGSLRWDGIKGTVDLFNIETKDWERLYIDNSDRNTSYLLEVRHFIECIKTGQEAGITGQDGKAVLEVIEAARRSAEVGQIVKIKNLGDIS